MSRVHDAVVSELTESHPRAAADAGAFERFFAAERNRLVRACLLLTGSVHEAEDLAQEALSRVLERWDEVSRMDSPAGYLYRTAMNVERKRIRRVAVAARHVIRGDERDEAAISDDRLDVLRAVSRLPLPQREALVLVEWLGYSMEEAGSVLGIEAVSVRGRLHRARSSLRRTLGDER